MYIANGNYDLRSYQPRVDLGIKWESVGGVYHPVDYGTETTHVSTTITVSGAPNEMEYLRTTLDGMNGSYFDYECYPGETPWGATFDHAKPDVAAYQCAASGVGDVQNVNGVLSTLTFTLHAITDMSGGTYDYSPWPGSANMYIESYASSTDRQTKHINTMAGIASSAFMWSAPAVDVNYIMKRVHANHFMSYIYKKRSGSFYLPAVVDLFGDGSSNNEVYCAGYPQESMLDSAGGYYKIRATFVRKQ